MRSGLIVASGSATAFVWWSVPWMALMLLLLLLRLVLSMLLWWMSLLLLLLLLVRSFSVLSTSS